MLTALFVAFILSFTTHADAQSGRLVEFVYTATHRAQIAIWVEDDAGNFMDTIRLTASVAKYGVGNRPGALQTNSGYRWPYGRRESALPIWAYRRASAPGAMLFKRVIFQNGGDEGRVARSLVTASRFDSTRDDYFCLSGNNENNALDAVTCASVFTGDKGRFITDDDVTDGYFEPYNENGTAGTRPLDLWSMYPPRRDITETSSNDHDDAGLFDDEAAAVMPNIDAITMATPQGNVPQKIQYEVPQSWPPGNYVAFIEAHVEGDHNDTFDTNAYPTPLGDGWTDGWVTRFGYPYRGQPSIVYKVPFDLSTAGEYKTSSATGFSEIHGLDGELRRMDSSITDNPSSNPGSGADRLQMAAGSRFAVKVVATAVCLGENPPPECSVVCGDDSGCASGFLCGTESTCVGECDIQTQPQSISGVEITNHINEKWSHRIATLKFEIPESRRSVSGYAIRSSTSAIDATTFVAADDVRAPDQNDDGEIIPLPGAALQIPSATDCVDSSQPFCKPFIAESDGVCPTGIDSNRDGDCLDAGDEVEVDIAFLKHESTYHVALQAVDSCLGQGDLSMSSVTTSKINFTTVSPCFVATAVYGTPLANDIWALRRFRDRYLMNNRLGLAFVKAYYVVGPSAARVIENRPWLKTLTRWSLSPLVLLSKWLTNQSDPAS